MREAAGGEIERGEIRQCRSPGFLERRKKPGKSQNDPRNEAKRHKDGRPPLLLEQRTPPLIPTPLSPTTECNDRNSQVNSNNSNTIPISA